MRPATLKLASSLTTSAPDVGETHGDAWRSRPPYVRARLAREGCRRRARPDRLARAAGHGLRGTRRSSADHRSLHIHPLSDRVRVGGAIEDPGSRPRLIARPDDRRDDPSARRGERRSSESGHARVDARAPRRRDHAAGRRCEARVHRGPPLEADADRLHERPRSDDPRRPAPEAVRVFGGCRRIRPRAPGVRSGCDER